VEAWAGGAEVEEVVVGGEGGGEVLAVADDEGFVDAAAVHFGEEVLGAPGWEEGGLGGPAGEGEGVEEAEVGGWMKVGGR